MSTPILIAALLAAAVRPPFLPPPDAERLGCSATLVTDDFKQSWWHVHVWAERPTEPRWSILYAVHEANERRKALNSCDEWLNRVQKHAQKQRGSRAK